MTGHQAPRALHSAAGWWKRAATTTEPRANSTKPPRRAMAPRREARGNALRRIRVPVAVSGPLCPFRTLHLSYRLLRLVRTRLLNFSKILVAATKTPPSHTPPPPLLSLASAARAPSCYLPPWRNIVDPAPHQVRGGDHPRATRHGYHPPLLPPPTSPPNHPTTTTLLSSLHLLHPRVAPT